MKFHSVGHTIYLFIFLTATGTVYGQKSDSSQLIVHVSPRNTILILDTSHIRQGEILQVVPGTHIIKSWGAKRELVIDTFQIYADSSFVYIKNLPYTESYLQYRSSIRKQKSKAVIPLVATGAVVILSHLMRNDLSSKLDDNSDLAKSAKANYDLAITQPQLDYYKSLYNDYSDKYDHLRSTSNSVAIASTILVAAGIATTLYIITKKHAPYTEQPLLSRVNAGFSLDGNSSMAGTVTYKF